MDATKKLTVIVPFLNEGVEVYNTVKNIRDTSNYHDVEIIIINDASTDGYDYRSVADEFNARYIIHSERKGVAMSRDEGIRISNTDFFLLLDAHMRMPEINWVSYLTRELENDQRGLLCCQTLPVTTNSQDEIIEHPKVTTGYGAYIDFGNNDKFSLKWILKDYYPDLKIIDIPCVLGAAYACAKQYWEYLLGLQGLRSYGCDEQLISMKVWLEGGKCKLIKDLHVKHIYRSEAPYPTMTSDMIFNSLYIAELFFHQDLKYQVFKNAEKSNSFLYKKAMIALSNAKVELKEGKRHFSEIFTRDIHSYIEMNNSYKITH